MFNLRSFVMDTLRKMSHIYPEAQVREFALDYYAKGWILDEDLVEVDSWYAEPDPAPAFDEDDEDTEEATEG